MSDYIDARLSAADLSKPRNVEEIVKAAKEYEYNAQVPVRYWLRTAAALLKEADIYMREGDDETTYLLLFRHAHLVLAHLEAHPDARDKSIKPLLSQARREVDRNLKVLDALKPRINQRHERYTSIIRERDERRAAQPQSTVRTDATRDDRAGQTSKRKIQQLRGHEDSDLAVRLAQQEFQRRANTRGSAIHTSSRKTENNEELSDRLQAIRSRVDAGSTRDEHHYTPSVVRDGTGAGYHYPNVKTQKAFEPPISIPRPHVRNAADLDRAPSMPPSLPPKPSAISSHPAPPRPDKLSGKNTLSTATALNTTDTTYTFAPSASLENGNPLRTIFLPPTLRTTFLRLAYQNTKANLETCGFLAGTLISNALFVSKLIIPAQIATSDTCEMTNESQLFDYVDSGADLMILGWIHTHPSQTCFMSSRDLHTHAGYQMMLPESIAIVCAPSKGDTSHGGDWGAYRLTDPPGKMAILNCNKPGIFHPHEVDNIYTDALRPGHVVEAKGLEFEVVDLRNT